MGSLRRTAGRTITALLTSGLLGVGVYLGTPVRADPGFCGAHEDPFSCTAKLQTGPPTAGESTFINTVRGHVPGTDAELLNTGRTICVMLKGGDSPQYVRSSVATHLGTNNGSAGQVLDQATEDICPDALH